MFANPAAECKANGRVCHRPCSRRVSLSEAPWMHGGTRVPAPKLEACGTTSQVT